MTAKRLYLGLIGLICILLLALLGGTYSINKRLSAEAVKLTSVKAKSQAQQQEQVSLTKAKRDVLKYADLQRVAQIIVPQDKNQAAAVRELVTIAKNYNITLTSITFPASTLGNSTPTGANAAPSAAAGAKAATPAVGAATTPAQALANLKAADLSQLEVVPGITGVYQLTIDVQGDPDTPVEYPKFIAFLDALEHNRRTAQVSSINITPLEGKPNLLNFSLSINEYIKP